METHIKQELVREFPLLVEQFDIDLGFIGTIN